jgi:AraC family transcriptional regulator
VAVFRLRGASDVLSTVRLSLGAGFSLELQRMPPAEVVLPMRRWHLLTLFLSRPTTVWREACGTAAAGELALHPVGPGGRVTWPGGVHALHLHLTPARLRALAGAPFRLRPIFPLRDPLLADAMAALPAYPRPAVAGAPSPADAVVDEICRRLLDRYAEPAPDAVTPRIGRLTIDQVQALVGESLDQPHQVSDLAARAGITRWHFSRRYHALVGMPPHHSLLRIRVERAKYLLLDPDLTVSEVAYRVGFADHSHLTRAFRRYVGRTPVQYRRYALQRARLF